MLTISFKNVGQGDTIIIEWIDQGRTKIGIIDSHVYKSRNPTLEYLKAHNYKRIEFYLLSHGHYDHYSGISDVLDYCSQKKIIINIFYHTLSGTIVKIFKFYNRTKKAKAAETLLLNLEKYSKGRNRIILKRVRIDCERPNIRLNDLIDINVLSPSEVDYFELEKTIGMYIGGKCKTIPNANKVSTILKIICKDEYILLSSDALKSRIGRIEKFLTNDKLIIGQVPHHGSDKNHRKQFWENVDRNNKCIAVFSTGDELADKLPNDITVKDIHSLNYKIHSTNQVNGICSVFGNPIRPIIFDDTISDILDFFSSDESPQVFSELNNDLNGDQLFNVWN